MCQSKFVEKILKRITLYRVKQSKYNKIFTHCKEEEKSILFQLSKSLDEKKIMVEIGSYLGSSSCFLAWGACKKANTLFCIDTWENDAMTEGTRDTYSEFLSNTKDFENFIKPLRGNSIDIARTFKEKIDLLFIDGDHSYEGCYQDWIAWSALLNTGAVVIFHDIGWAEGVQKVINEEIVPRASKEGRLPNLYWAWI